MALTRRNVFITLAAIAAGATLAQPVAAQDKSITVASTTSTEQSGLFNHILPAFTTKSGINVRVVAVGTGQALDIGRRGDADVVFVTIARPRTSSWPRAPAWIGATSCTTTSF